MKHLALWVLWVLCAACGRDTDAILKAPPKSRLGSAGSAGSAAVVKPLARVKLDGLTTTLPTGWTATYDSLGRWSFTSPKLADGRETTAQLAQISVAVEPTPEDYLALRAHLLDKGTSATIVATQTLPDGFAMTVEVTPAAAPDRPKHEIYVLRHLGVTWLDCQCEWVPNDVIRDQVIALCASANL